MKWYCGVRNQRTGGSRYFWIDADSFSDAQKECLCHAFRTDKTWRSLLLLSVRPAALGQVPPDEEDAA